MDLGYVALEPSDRWTECFYTDRWYNVFEIHAADDSLKGWYCNITRPAPPRTWRSICGSRPTGRCWCWTKTSSPRLRCPPPSTTPLSRPWPNCKRW
ncbi:MAG: hypothetical protein B6I35_10355 [Anaerolineaceae bacterium 4572_32.2]|nr:MAG: hypothetical protein B6I35_10355 [Anaerolineaceae bacterium 4572_32.2]